MASGLIFLIHFNPPTTAVQIERRADAWMSSETYRKRYQFEPMLQISPHLAHAVVAAEDGRFYTHHGFDWKEVGSAIEENRREGRVRGASTLTQQLARNLFLSTNPSIVRKAVEFSIVPLFEAILSKQRILELYLNVVEWGPGIYGAEAAAETYYHTPAQWLTRDEAAELASLLPAPLHRRPGHVEWYVHRIKQRMREMGW